MLIIGTVTWIGNAALGLPGAFALGVIAGIMELIPNLGPFLAAIPAVIVALIQGSTYIGVSHWIFALIIIGFYVLVQQFENTFVVPRILGDAVNLHPLVVMLGVLIGANVAGILGALLAAPVIASGREIVRYLYQKILGEEPFPPEQEETEEVESPLWKQGKLLALKLRSMLVRPAPAKSATPPVQETSPQSSEESKT
jgi:predicted PurR-regulated permease PerM